MFLDINGTGGSGSQKNVPRAILRGMRLRVYLELSELRQHVERRDLLRQSLCNEINASRSIGPRIDQDAK